MGRNSRSRKVLKKKKETNKFEPMSAREEETATGSLMSMRAGLKSIAGTGENEAPPSKTSQILTWVLLAAALIGFIFFFVSR